MMHARTRRVASIRFSDFPNTSLFRSGYPTFTTTLPDHGHGLRPAKYGG
jgi:hypothetical protein